MNDYMPWVLGAVMLALTILSFYGGWVLRIAKGENASDTAKAALLAAQAVAADLASFKTEVARDYASNRMIEQMEDRLVKAIERLGDRLDSWVDRAESSRTAPRTRATKS